jgi:hypothetical protein
MAAEGTGRAMLRKVEQHQEAGRNIPLDIWFLAKEAMTDQHGVKGATETTWITS